MDTNDPCFEAYLLAEDLQNVLLNLCLGNNVHSGHYHEVEELIEELKRFLKVVSAASFHQIEELRQRVSRVILDTQQPVNSTLETAMDDLTALFSNLTI